MIHTLEHDPTQQETAECQVCSAIRHRAFNALDYPVSERDADWLIVRMRELLEEFGARGPAA